MDKWEPLIDRMIKESMDRGEFDNLPGSGEPIDLTENPYEAPASSDQAGKPKKRRRFDLYDVIAIGVCLWFLLPILVGLCMTWLVATGGGFRD